MLQNITVLVNGMAAGLFGLSSILFLFVFERKRLRTVLGIVLAVYTLLFIKDIIYFCPAVAENGFLYRVLLSIDNWAVPLYVIYAFEVIAPGRMTAWRTACLLLPFPMLTFLYLCFPTEAVYSFSVAFSALFSAACMSVVLFLTFRYRRMLKDNCSDITNMDIKWMWVSIALFLPNLVLWTLVSARYDCLLDSVYYVTLSLSWGIVAWNTYYYIPLSSEDMSCSAQNLQTYPETHFSARLEELASQDYFVRSPRLTLSELASCLGTNRTTLSNYLNSELGTNFYDYINSHRLAHAESLLSDLSVKYSTEALAELSGFGSLSTFRRAFFKKHGMTPQEYRRRLEGA